MKKLPNLAKPEKCASCPGFSPTISTGFAPPDSFEKWKRGRIKFALLGEALGETEALTGLPFSGQTGQLYESEVLSVFGLTFADILRDNVLRCRPTNNKFPPPHRAAEMAIHCRQWDTVLDLYTPTVIILSYHLTFSLIRNKTARFSAYNTVRKALRLGANGERPLIASGDHAKNLLFPLLPGTISRWDGKHFFVDWRGSGASFDPEAFKRERAEKKEARGPSLRELIRRKT